MTPAELLDRLVAPGVVLQMKDERLILDGPDDVLTDEAVAACTTHRWVLEWLAVGGRRATPGWCALTATHYSSSPPSAWVAPAS